jgi:hypothetical protein
LITILKYNMLGVKKKISPTTTPCPPVRKRRNSAKFPPLERIEPDVPAHLAQHPSATDLCQPPGELFWGKGALGHEDIKTTAIHPPVVNQHLGRP